MIAEQFGGNSIIRPGHDSEAWLRERSEHHLRSKFDIGTYEDPRAVNAIVQHQYRFYAEVLSDLLPAVASRDFLTFVLDQYDHATAIEVQSKRYELSPEQQSRWDELGPTFRRAAKYLAERTTMLTPPPTPPASRVELERLTDLIWSCAEQMLEYAMLSDATHSVFPDRVVLKILPPGDLNYLEHEFKGVDFRDDKQRMRRDLNNRSRFLPTADTIFHDLDFHDRLLGRAMEAGIGLSYKGALSLLARAIDGSRPPAYGFPIPFIHKEMAIERLANASGVNLETVRQVIDGFTVRAEDMWQEGREIWKPKQENRALRRGFLEFPHATGVHLAFSPAMAKEAFAALQRGVVFGHLPREWRTPKVTAALSQLANEVGSWFEQQVQTNLAELGCTSVINAKNAVGTGPKRIRIPSKVGELDYLGYSPRERLLVLLECKFVQDSVEPRFYRDDVSAFVTGRNSYLDRYRRKFSWIRENWGAVCEAMETVVPNRAISIQPTRIAGAIVTFFPTIASRFIGDFPCVSLPEFRLDYEDAGQWPYSHGVYPL